MNKIKELGPLFTAGIFFVGFLALLLTGFNMLLNAKIEPVNTKIEHVKENQVRFERRLDRIEVKLDQVLIHKKAMAK